MNRRINRYQLINDTVRESRQWRSTESKVELIAIRCRYRSATTRSIRLSIQIIAALVWCMHKVSSHLSFRAQVRSSLPIVGETRRVPRVVTSARESIRPPTRRSAARGARPVANDPHERGDHLRLFFREFSKVDARAPPSCRACAGGSLRLNQIG